MQDVKDIKKRIEEDLDDEQDGGGEDKTTLAKTLKSIDQKLAAEAAARAADKAKSPVLYRKTMTKKEKSDFIAKHGSAAYLKLPWTN